MVRVVINKDRNGNIYAFCANGHAGGVYGSDIHCAAISAIIQTAVIGLSDHAGLNLELDISDGHLECEFNKQDAAREDVKAITGTMLLGLRSFQKENKRYLKLIEEVL